MTMPILMVMGEDGGPTADEDVVRETNEDGDPIVIMSIVAERLRVGVERV